MTTGDVDRYSRLWTSDAKKYVLVHFRLDATGPEHRLIFNKETRMAELIEDSELASEVMRRMVETGVEIVNELPPTTPA
jgi:hypothetical protein